MPTIDLNCDMGEGMPYDADIMPCVTSVNIACGYHAGNEEIMKKTIDLALNYNVALGAHPGFADTENFGRKEIYLLRGVYYDLIIEQLTILKKITDSFNTTIHHVKPHGALYNMSARDKTLASIIAQAIKDFDNKLILYGLSGSESIREAKSLNLQTANEVFADRTYQDDGTLTPRSQTNALIEDENACVQQVLQMITQKTVTSVNNKTIPIIAETICIHGDGEHAVEFAQLIHQNLKQNNIAIRAY
jgi:5-oxoprolinase (ATP-hydrolysing) subunit A